MNNRFGEALFFGKLARGCGRKYHYPRGAIPKDHQSLAPAPPVAARVEKWAFCLCYAVIRFHLYRRTGGVGVIEW